MKTFNEQATAVAVRTQTAIETVAHRLGGRVRDEAGQTTAEYVAVIVLIAAIIGAVAGSDSIRTAVSQAITEAFNTVKDSVTGEG